MPPQHPNQRYSPASPSSLQSLGLHCDLNCGIQLKRDSRIKKREKDKNPAGSDLLPDLWFDTETQKFMCQEGVGANSQEQGRYRTAEKQTHQPHHSPSPTGKEQLTPAFLPGLLQHCLRHFPSPLPWVWSTDRASYSSLLKLSSPSPLVGQ